MPRQPDHHIDPIFTERSSPRSFTGEPVPDEVLFSLFEAARWAPSSSNVQPWRLIYAKRDTPEWQPIYDCLMPINQRWAVNASALIVFISDIEMKRGDQTVVSAWHSFDTGAAWMSLALQAHRLDWATRGMGGFFNDKLRAALQVPQRFHIDAVVALGKRASPEALPEDMRAREVPTDRRPLSETLVHGSFAQSAAD